MWRSSVEFFAAGVWHDRRRHVVQQRFGSDGDVGCKWLEVGIAHDRVHGAAAHDHAARGRGSQTALCSIPAAETS